MTGSSPGGPGSGEDCVNVRILWFINRWWSGAQPELCQCCVRRAEAKKRNEKGKQKDKATQADESEDEGRNRDKGERLVHQVGEAGRPPRRPRPRATGQGRGPDSVNNPINKFQSIWRYLYLDTRSKKQSLHRRFRQPKKRMLVKPQRKHCSTASCHCLCMGIRRNAQTVVYNIIMQ